jgi:hypothetical protein
LKEFVRDLFKTDDPRADLSYVNARAPKHEDAERARRCCDDLWNDFEALASDHFLAEFPYRFHQRWFEMYLAVALLRAGLDIEYPPKASPDVRVKLAEGRSLWIEAVAPTGGAECNPDRVVEPPRTKGEPVGYYVPTEQVTLRVSGALLDKAKQLRTYRENGVIGPNDQAIVAINVSLIPHAFYDAETYGVAAAYGVGPRYVVIDRDTGKAVDSGYRYRSELLRSSGSSVDVAPFLHSGFEHVTGALISPANAAARLVPLGHDFMLLPNPRAAPPHVVGQIPLGREWRLREVDGGYRVEEIIEHSRAEPVDLARI